MTPRWIRKQIDADRLPARVLTTGRRATYRIRASDLAAFRDRWIIEAPSVSAIRRVTHDEREA